MKETKEIANYIADRIKYYQTRLKSEKDETRKIWIQGQIFESTRILKYIQNEYKINPYQN